MTRDPKESEVRREVGWVDGYFVELTLRSCKDGFEIAVLMDGDAHEIVTKEHLIDAMTIFDSLEWEVLKTNQNQGVAV